MTMCLLDYFFIPFLRKLKADQVFRQELFKIPFLRNMRSHYMRHLSNTCSYGSCSNCFFWYLLWYLQIVLWSNRGYFAICNYWNDCHMETRLCTQMVKTFDTGEDGHNLLYLAFSFKCVIMVIYVRNSLILHFDLLFLI